MQYNYKLTENISSLGFEICNELLKSKHLPVILCLGSSKVVADSIGPIAGTLLTTKYNIDTFVYGNLKNNVAAENLDDYYSFIKQTHPQSKIIVIDSGLGSMSDVGLVKFNKGHIYSKALESSNKFKAVGDYSLLGIINTTGINNLLFLKSVKLDTCFNIANFICKSLTCAFDIYFNTHKMVMNK